MSDIKSLILPFFLRHYLFLCLSYYLFSCFRLCLCYSLFLCLRYCLFSVFVIAQPIIRLFKMQKLIIKKTKNKVFAQRDKCYMGWFFILKFHLICNENGELLNFYSGKLVDMPRKWYSYSTEYGDKVKIIQPILGLQYKSIQLF